MGLVPRTEAERELYCLLDRDPPTEAEWRMLQQRWSTIFRAPVAGQSYALEHLDENLHQQMRG